MAHRNKNLSVEMKDMDSNVAAELMKRYTGERTGFVLLGPKSYVMPNKYKQMADEIYNLPLRDDDVFIVSYPRSGTTWTQELIWLVVNNLDYETAANVHRMQRFPYIEISSLFHPDIEQQLLRKNSHIEKNVKFLQSLMIPGTEVVSNLPSPRLIKSHMPLSLLPPTLLDKTKVVYVARDPRDVAVSYYHHYKDLYFMGFAGEFKDFWRLFVKDLVCYSPFFEHVKEAWDLRHHPNMVFLFYEDLLKDLGTGIRRVCKQLGKQYCERDTERLCEHLRFDNFKEKKSIEIPSEIIGLASETMKFVRKGKAGGWRDYFDEEMTLEAERWMGENLRNTDMRFPSHTK